MPSSTNIHTVLRTTVNAKNPIHEKRDKPITEGFTRLIVTNVRPIRNAASDRHKHFVLTGKIPGNPHIVSEHCNSLQTNYLPAYFSHKGVRL